MTSVVQGRQRSTYARNIHQMHLLRKTIYKNRVRWRVSIDKNWEIDAFDAAGPLRLPSIDPHRGDVGGALRPLPTNGPNMLRNVFHQLLPAGAVIGNATIWESTRVAVRPANLEERSGNGPKRTGGELITGLIGVGLMARLSHAVSAYDARMARLSKRAAYPAEIIGGPGLIWSAMTHAALFEISESALSRVRAAAGIEGSVLERSGTTWIAARAA